MKKLRNLISACLACLTLSSPAIVTADDSGTLNVQTITPGDDSAVSPRVRDWYQRMEKERQARKAEIDQRLRGIFDDVACPDAPNLIDVAVQPHVSFDQAYGLYSYSYVVENNIRSQQSVDAFAIDVQPPVHDGGAPKGWLSVPYSFRSSWGWMLGWPLFVSRLGEAAVIEGTPPQIDPGRSMDGFVIRSPHPPAPVLYFVHGHVKLPSELSDELDEESALEFRARCPSYSPRLPNYHFTAATLGPSTAVAMELVILPKSDAPGLQIAVLGNAKGNGRDVIPSSIRLWPDVVGLMPNQISLGDANADGMLDVILQLTSKQAQPQCFQRVYFVTGNFADGRKLSGYSGTGLPDCIDTPVASTVTESITIVAETPK